MRLLLYCLLAMLWPGAYSIAQKQTANIRPLSVGDTLPDLILENVLNNPHSKIETADYKDKLLIIDFFATWCGSCIKGLPKLDILQNEFSNKVSVIVVGHEPTEKIGSFLNNRLKKLELKIPFIGSDSVLIKLFPHRILPHSVWVYNKRIRAITYPSLITKDNIQKVLQSDPFVLPVKKDIADFDRKSRLLINSNGGTETDLLLQTSFISNLSGIGSKVGNSEEIENGLKRKYYINMPILALYSFAVPEAGTNKVLLKVKSKQRLIYEPEHWDLWSKENAFTYEVIYKSNLSNATLIRKMLHDLNAFFGYSASVEIAQVDCWILSKAGKASKTLATTGRQKEVSLYDKSSQKKIIYNAPLSELVEALNRQIPGQEILPIVIDETNYSKNVDLEINIKDLSNLAILSKELAPYGLELKQGKRNLKVLVITDN